MKNFLVVTEHPVERVLRTLVRPGSHQPCFPWAEIPLGLDWAHPVPDGRLRILPALYAAWVLHVSKKICALNGIANARARPFAQPIYRRHWLMLSPLIQFSRILSSCRQRPGCLPSLC